ncbi:GFA family protein [Halioxenophilus aromaticivorans]|uniref:GFA family protein n=1 Tax=Halioxenophilus aromaticivorans TaxID=1306992 RepID=A0AAV3U0Z4_9ALTE
MVYSGGCHCGAVRYTVEASGQLRADECNCSICYKLGYLHLIVPQSKFCLVKGERALTEYTFNTHVAKHRFCKHCGIKAFYVPRSHPDKISVNVRTFDELPQQLVVEPFDGKHWEQNVAALRAKDVHR